MYSRAEVIKILEEKLLDNAGITDVSQRVDLEILSGEDAGKIVTTDYVVSANQASVSDLQVGEVVVVARNNDARGDAYYVVDTFRLPSIGMFFVFFVLLAVFFGRKKGLGSLLGLGVSLGILLLFIVPNIFSGHNPLVICAIGSVAMACSSLFLAHGFNKRAAVALVATLITLGGAFLLAIVAVMVSSLSGGGTEEAIFLQMNYVSGLDLRGLLLGGIVIGALGVLDDVTTAQVAAVQEIHEANNDLSFSELYRRGLSVGREHIAALVNTLALAYVGAAFPMFLLFTLPDSPPLWVLLNTEQISEEIIRALVGGSALILAVPIATVLAAYYFSRQ